MEGEFLTFAQLRERYPIGKNLLYRLVRLLPSVAIGRKGGNPKRLVSKADMDRLLTRVAEENLNLVDVSKWPKERFDTWWRNHERN